MLSWFKLNADSKQLFAVCPASSSCLPSRFPVISHYKKVALQGLCVDSARTLRGL